MTEPSAEDDAFYEDNELVSKYADLLSSQKDRYLLQASELLKNGELVIAKDGYKYKYLLSENMISFHVDRNHNATSVSAKMPIPDDHSARLEKVISAFAQSEAVAKI
ncbi:MAG: hypothetical protein F2555_02675 [Actinobacteria bacterium]|uniref:Unannotated protein n=1 Tax=freshwater metagenome TaxID=449393 RepID=A0A6J6DY32_9ZZZZ|nr:hypothetical protein [Actinomycetota bacterium]